MKKELTIVTQEESREPSGILMEVEFKNVDREEALFMAGAFIVAQSSDIGISKEDMLEYIAYLWEE